MAKCKICRAEFVRRSMTQKVCGSVDCAIAWVAKENARKEAKRERDERRQDNAARLRLKTWSDWDKECKKACHRFIRARDYGLGCISCGKPLVLAGASSTGGAYDAGHYRSVGSSKHLRFDERNIHGQCKHCNSPRGLGGNYANQRLGLIARHGVEFVEALEADQTPRKYTIEDLKALKAEYSRRARELEKRHEDAR